MRKTYLHRAMRYEGFKFWRTISGCAAIPCKICGKHECIFCMSSSPVRIYKTSDFYCADCLPAEYAVPHFLKELP